MSDSSNSKISLVITDLDNTLYDWVTFFVQSFYAMLRVAAPLVGVSEEQLVEELRKVHQKHHNSEHPFALLEVASVQVRFPHHDRRQLAVELDPAFHAFNSKRKRTLELYPGVSETLGMLSERGVIVVGHTEATVPNALFRLRTLGITSFLRKLYAVEPSGEGHPSAAATDSPHGSLEVRWLRHDERKPDPRIILDICREFGVSPDETLYVGDSLSRDIGMAHEAGAVSAWAKYGTRYDKTLWDLLVRVTHWTAEDVARAEAARIRYGNTKPDAVLEASFDEILRHFRFQ